MAAYAPLHTAGSARRAEIQDTTPATDSQPPDAPSDGSRPGGILISNAARPSNAPKAVLDIKHIRLNVEMHRQNCLDRNYAAQSAYSAQIRDLFARWLSMQRDCRALRERGNLLRKQLANPATVSGADDPKMEQVRSLSREEIITEAKDIKTNLAERQGEEDELVRQMEELALAMPNLTSGDTPRGNQPAVLATINNDYAEPVPSSSDRVWRSHVYIGAELGLMDFNVAANASGWGWYYLVGEGAELEQALVQYALATVTRASSSHARAHHWLQVSPPSMVYSHVASACGFRPRDQHNEMQVYSVTQSDKDAVRGKPERCLAGTAEIPLAAMRADSEIEDTELPLKRVASSRCFRAEAGGRGVDTKGLYRVHEFTKVEMFTWTEPTWAAATEALNEMVDLQTEILASLGLHCRILEMPTSDLGASAARKIDIECFFPSRRDRNDGWGEVTSASICTDYQARRLGTRLKMPDGKTVFPWTVNGTALAVPRVLAALLETGWEEESLSVKVPEVLREWMGGKERLGLGLGLGGRSRRGFLVDE